MYYLVFFIGLLSGFWIYCSTREHLLSVLMSLEYLALIMFLVFIISFSGGSLYYSFMYLIMAACEGALGLSILINMNRTHGGDYFKSFNLFLV
uniref:NADH-ubiquinone oxidoreductase chain 4L n=1 Tax=Orchesella cincta TaxID=48709 RepID=A0A1L2E044_ORCCI|nr:NADH dehydrogenase subunit 4L [Orchesella cincta]ANJ04204.1 NADH dehydrogenase subunit 4L [Orchesella cincta]